MPPMSEPDWLAKARAEGRVLTDRQVRLNMGTTPGLPGLTATETEDGPESQRFELPYPPTVNTYWRSAIIGKTLATAHVHFYVSAGGKNYQDSVRKLFLMQRGQPMTGDLKFEADFHPPDKRQRDLDNLLKSVIDAMAKAGAYANDDQIQEIHVRLGKPMKGGMAYITLSRLSA